MSKLIKVMIVLLTIAAIATPVVAVAEDRLSLSGYYTLRGYVKDNADYDEDANDSTEYYYQRFRTAGTIAVAEGVQVKFRFDAVEGSGDDTEAVGNIEFDQAYGVVDQEAFTLSFGQMGAGFGNAMIIDRTRDQAVHVKLKALPLTLMAHKVTEGGTQSSLDDSDLYAAVLEHSTDLYSGAVFVGHLLGADDATRTGIAVAADFNLDPIKLSAELNYLMGETAAGADEKGLQLYANASMMATETVKVGGILTYAQSQDGGDTQINDLAGNDFSIETQGFMATAYSVYGGDSFQPGGTNEGVMGFQLYADADLMEGLKGHAHVIYAMPQDDDLAAYDSVMTYAASVRYALAANTNFDVIYSSSTPDLKVGDADPNTTAACRLTVSF